MVSPLGSALAPRADASFRVMYPIRGRRYARMRFRGVSAVCVGRATSEALRSGFKLPPPTDCYVRCGTSIRSSVDMPGPVGHAQAGVQ